MQNIFHWILIIATFLQAIAIVAKKPPIVLPRKQVAIMVAYFILILLDLLSSN
jgi:predicted small lipoprotein YifL